MPHCRITNGQGQVLAQTDNLSGLPGLKTSPAQEAQAPAGTLSWGTLTRGDMPLRGIYFPLDTVGMGWLLLVVAVPLAPLQQSLNSLLMVMGLTLVLGAGAAALGARRVAQYLTAPLERMADAARNIGREPLQTRIPEIAVDAELRTVETALNQMLARLEQAFEVQRQLVDAQRRFIADASHELRSPLTNLQGTVEVALRRPRSLAEYQEVLTISLAEISRLTRLVEMLLLLSRADAGRLTLERSPCDLRELAERSLRVHAAKAEAKGVRLGLEAPVSALVLGDADRLREVIDNLLDNAFRHSAPGDRVTITASSEAGMAQYSLQDMGLGLSEAEQAQVFERFYRADASRDRDSGGLGPGLAIAKAIVDAHGGTLTVRSQPGQGATFVMTLPGMDGTKD